jgi:hypothetical protein
LAPPPVSAAQLNREKSSKFNSTSKHYGVSWDKKSRKWRASVRVNGVTEHLGYYFDDEVEAAKAVDKFLREEGKLENVNFDDKGDFIYAPRKSSQYTGVSWHSRRKKWKVYITVPGENKKSLGSFEDEADAARAYDAVARKHNKATNF